MEDGCAAERSVTTPHRGSRRPGVSRRDSLLRLVGISASSSSPGGLDALPSIPSGANLELPSFTFPPAVDPLPSERSFQGIHLSGAKGRLEGVELRPCLPRPITAPQLSVIFILDSTGRGKNEDGRQKAGRGAVKCPGRDRLWNPLQLRFVSCALRLHLHQFTTSHLPVPP